MSTASDRYIARSQRLFLGFLAIFGAAVIAGGFFLWSAFSELRASEEAVSALETAADEAAADVVAAAEELESATDYVGSAEAGLENVTFEVNVENAVRAREFDDAVEALARAGQVERNPFSGLGIPPQSLLNDYSRETSDLTLRITEATAVVTEAKAAQEEAATVLIAEEATAAALTVAVAEAETIAAERADELFVKAAVTIAGLVVLAALAGAFGISAARAKATAPGRD